MSEKSYWQERQEQRFINGERKINQYYKELEKSFEQSKKEIQKVINDFYVRYAIENRSPSFVLAQINLNKTEIGDLQAFIDKVNESMGKYNQELNNISIKARITRYQALEKQIDAILQQLYSIDYQYKGKELLKDVYSDSYYRTWFNIDQYHGFHKEFARINPHAIEELIKYPFDGANYSTRLWKQKEHMLQQLRESITTMLIQGKNPNTLSMDFARKFNTKESEAYRLLHTEGAFIIEQGALAAYKEDGVEKYQILATLDIKTSEICRDADSEIYDIDKAITGVNYPPLHAFCRSTTVPYYQDYQDDEVNTRSARDLITGKAKTVPADMSYSEWYKEYISNNPRALAEEKKVKNKSSDKNQFENYKKVIGNDFPKSFEKFQELKYNNSEEWLELKEYFNYKSDNPESNKEYFLVNQKMQELRDAGIIKIKGTVVKPIEQSIKELNEHTLIRMNQRGITKEDAQAFIDNSIIAFKQRLGTQHAYYSENGFIAISTDGTVGSTGWLDENGKIIIEEAKKIL